MAEREVNLKFSAEGAERVSDAISRIGRSSATTAGQAKTLQASIDASAKSFASFGSTLLQIPQALVNTGRVIRGVLTGLSQLTIGTLKEADAVIDVRSAFENWTRSMGGATKVLQQLRAAVGDEVGVTELQRTALTFAARGVELNVEQLSTLFRVTKQITDVTGRDFTGMLDRLAMAFSRGSISAIATTLGIENFRRSQIAALVGLEDGEKALTSQQVAAIGLQLAMERSTEINEIFGQSQENLGDQASQLSAKFQNFKDDLIVAIATNQELAKSLDGLGTVFKNLGVEGETTGQVIGNAFAKAATFITDSISKIVLAAKGLQSILQDVIADFTEGMNDLLPELTREFQGFGDFLERNFPDLATDIMEFGEQIDEVMGNLPKALREESKKNEDQFVKMEKQFEEARNRRDKQPTPKGEIEVTITEDESAIRQKVRETSDKIVSDVLLEVQRRQQEAELLNAQSAGK